MGSMTRTVGLLTPLCALALAAAPAPALAYPNNEADCKAAGGVWKEKDTPDGCVGFCFMKLEAMVHGRGGGGGGSGGVYSAALDTARRDLASTRKGGAPLAGDVAIAIADRSMMAAGATTCRPDPGRAGSAQGEWIGVVAVASDLEFVDAGGVVVVLDGLYRIRVATEPGALPTATFVDAAGREVLRAAAEIVLNPKLAPEVPGGDPRVAWTRDGAVIDFQWQGVRMRVLPTVNK